MDIKLVFIWRILISMEIKKKNIFFFDGDEYKWNKRWLTNLKKLKAQKK